MDAIDAILSRKSTRAYKATQVSDDTLQTILQAGCAAPVATGSYDSLHITVVQDKAILKQISSGATDMATKILGVKKDMDFGAPTMIVVSSCPSKIPGHENFNAATVLENMAIAATSLGVDNIMWGAAAAVVEQVPHIKQSLDIPQGYKALLCLSLGYALVDEPAKEHNIDINFVQ